MSQIVALPTAVINGTSVRNGDGPLPLSASLDELLDQARDLEGAGRFAKAADVWDEAAMLAGAAGDMTLVEQIRLAAARCKIEIGATEAAESDLAVAVASPDPSISGPAAQTLAASTSGGATLGRPNGGIGTPPYGSTNLDGPSTSPTSSRVSANASDV
jgi:hypothetical protein